MGFDTQRLKRLPEKPGVYLMKDAQGKPLYIGKANNLRQRVRQYFTPGSDTREMIPYLLAHLADLQTIVVESETEALLLENTLIKKHRPRYNILLRDDKSFLSLAIDLKHPWPMVRVVRSKDKPLKNTLHFGPYPSSHDARQTLDLINQLFPLRECRDKELLNRTRPCILYEMHRCLAPCVGKCSKEEYHHLVEEVVAFLQGHHPRALAKIKEQMHQAAKRLDFETAAILRNRLEAVEKILEKQNVDGKAPRDSDAIGLYRQASTVTLAKATYRQGKLLAIFPYHFTNTLEDDEEVLSSFLLQHYLTRTEMPHEILLPEKLQQAELLEKLLGESKKRTPKVLFPQRGEKLSWIKTANANAESNFHQERDEKTLRDDALADLQERCHLNRFPGKIECFDTSHLAGTDHVAAMVAFHDGKKHTKGYRTFCLHTSHGDDYAAMREVLTRRYERGKKEDNLPDLLIVDGGKGHLRLAQEILETLNIPHVEILALAKEQGRHDKGLSSEKIFLPGEKESLALPRHSPTLLFLQKIRDEAHRFALAFQKKQRHQPLSQKKGKKERQS